MGLDIYVRWGRKDDGTEDGDSWPDFPAERKDDQHNCGFRSGPHVGYLRESWPSLRWVRDYAASLNAPDPYTFFANWEGSNGEHLVCDTAGLAAVCAFRDTVLLPWTRDKTARDAFYTEARAKYDARIKTPLPVDATREAMLAVITADEKAWQELTGEYDAFRQRVADVIGFLNFVELHRAEPGLTICFY